MVASLEFSNTKQDNNNKNGYHKTKIAARKKEGQKYCKLKTWLKHIYPSRFSNYLFKQSGFRII